MKESAITKSIMTWLKAQPDVFAWKTIGSAFTMRGIPDICGNVGAQALYLEVKTVRGRLSPSQKVIANRVTKSGARVWTVRSLDDAKHAVLALRESTFLPQH